MQGGDQSTLAILGVCDWEDLSVRVNDIHGGENMILDPIADDAKSTPPVMQKPYITCTNSHRQALAYWVVRDTRYAYTQLHSPQWCRKCRRVCVWVSLCANTCSCVSVYVCRSEVYTHLSQCKYYLIKLYNYLPTPLKPLKKAHSFQSFSFTHTQYMHLKKKGTA